MIIAIVILSWLLSGTIVMAIIFGIMWRKTDKQLSRLEEQLENILIDSRAFDIKED